MDGVDLVQRALRLRIEDTDRVDLVVEQFDAIRLLGAHRVHVEQATAYGEVARVEHLRHVAVTRALESAFLRIQVQSVAELEVEAAAGDVAQRRKSLQQRLYRNDDDAAIQRWHAMQCGETLADDIRMRTETVVWQRFPIREMHDGRRRRGRLLRGLFALCMTCQQCAQVALELL